MSLKIQSLRAVNLFLLISFSVQACTAVIMFFELNIPGLSYVFKIHEYNGGVLIFLAFIHIILNLGWIKANFFRKKE